MNDVEFRSALDSWFAALDGILPPLEEGDFDAKHEIINDYGCVDTTLTFDPSVGRWAVDGVFTKRSKHRLSENLYPDGEAQRRAEALAGTLLQEWYIHNVGVWEPNPQATGDQCPYTKVGEVTTIFRGGGIRLIHPVDRMELVKVVDAFLTSST